MIDGSSILVVVVVVVMVVFLNVVVGLGVICTRGEVTSTDQLPIYVQLSLVASQPDKHENEQ